MNETRHRVWWPGDDEPTDVTLLLTVNREHVRRDPDGFWRGADSPRNGTARGQGWDELLSDEGPLIDDGIQSLDELNRLGESLGELRELVNSSLTVEQEIRARTLDSAGRVVTGVIEALGWNDSPVGVAEVAQVAQVWLMLANAGLAFIRDGLDDEAHAETEA